jgi:hypothetical protein
MQPSRFVLVRDYDVRRAVHGAFLQANEQALASYTGDRREQYARLKLEGILEAPQNLCVLRDPKSERGHQLGRHMMPETAIYSTVCAIQNLWLAARAEGVGEGSWNCLAARNLEQEATSVIDAIDSEDLPLARHRLARIVGRDTQHLDTQEICRALIETLAESTSDSILAALFYMALGGVPLVMAYKAVNTLDSVIGHADERYFYFGKAAVRLDDVANYLPARLTASAIVAVSQFNEHCDQVAAWQTWRGDGDKHKSPMPASLKAPWQERCTFDLETTIPTAASWVVLRILAVNFHRHHCRKSKAHSG